jgi:hypothetical protein
VPRTTLTRKQKATNVPVSSKSIQDSEIRRNHAQGSSVDRVSSHTMGPEGQSRFEKGVNFNIDCHSPQLDTGYLIPSSEG